MNEKSINQNNINNINAGNNSVNNLNFAKKIESIL